MFKRTDAIEMNITDENDKSKIVKFIVVNDEGLVLKENSIYKILLAESIDKENKYPNTKHSQEKLYSIGTKSPIISRIIVQSDELLKLMNNELLGDKTFLLNHIWKANQLLIKCYESFSYIESEINRLIPICDKIIEDNKKKRYIPPLPKIKELEAKVHIFYSSAKLFLIEVFKLFDIFFLMPINDREVAHFEKHIKWLETKFGESSELCKMLNIDIEWIRILSECRNAIEHKKEGQSLSVYDFSIQPDNKFSLPQLSYDLTNKLSLKAEKISLYHDLDTLLHNLLELFENTLIISIDEKLKDNKLLKLYRIKDSDININCPVFYRISLKEEFLK